MTAADQLEIYNRMRQLGQQVAHGTHSRHDASRSAFYLSHTLAHHRPQSTQERHQAFLEHLIDDAIKTESHRMARAEGNIRRAVRPLFDQMRPGDEIQHRAIAAADGGLTLAEIEMTLTEEMAWLDRRQRRIANGH